MPNPATYPDLPLVMTASEVAGLLRVSKATVTRLNHSGDLPALPIRGRLLFRSDEVARFMNRGRRTPMPLPGQADELPPP
ncbi:helix-turn-helix domain-containing protein [Bosea sp. (in: a-proteobacteria)]|uniref:helix-turn-helix domain-containing protein n=1 Tax=Bosea sp. (in: a-proteobacteria) TaxID=1871050 RepID=UPI003F7112E4